MGMVTGHRDTTTVTGYFAENAPSTVTPGSTTTALGAVGITVEKKADVPKAIKQMLEEKRPCVVDFRVEREENVWPMVPAGKSINEMDGLDILESMA